MVSRIAHVHIPDEFRRPNSSIEIPGFGLLPFGHSRFDRGGIIYAEFEPGRSMLGTHRIRPTGRGSADEPGRTARKRTPRAGRRYPLRRAERRGATCPSPDQWAEHPHRRALPRRPSPAARRRRARAQPAGRSRPEPGPARHHEPRLEVGCPDQRHGARRIARHLPVRALPGGPARHDALAGANRTHVAGARSRRTANTVGRAFHHPGRTTAHGRTAGRLRRRL